MDTRIKAVQFDEENHKYFYDGKELHGVTGAIGKLMGKSFPDTDTVKLATIYGSDVHKEIELYYNEHTNRLSTEGAKWIVQELTERAKCRVHNSNVKIECEVMVSDFIGTASKVDVVMHTEDGAYLFDIKTTTHFDREYCSLQLSVYKELYEKCYGEKVIGMYVIGTKAKRFFRIIEQEHTKIEKILNMNKGE